MANGAPGRPVAAELKVRCSAQNAAGSRCGNPAVGGGSLCMPHLGRLDAHERAELRKTRVESAKLMAAGRTQAIGALIKIILSGTNPEKIAASRVLLAATALPDEVRLTNHLLLADLDTAGAVDAATPGELVRERLAVLRARQAPVDGTPSPGDAEVSLATTGPGTGQPAPVIALPSVGPLVQRQLLPGRPVGGPAVIDAEPMDASADSSASRRHLGSSAPAGPVGASHTRPGTGNAMPCADTTGAGDETDHSALDYTADDLVPVDPEPISVDIVDTVDAVDTPCSSAFTDDGRGEQRMDHALPGWVAGRRRRSVADDSELIVPAAPGVPPVRRRRTTADEVARRRPYLGL